MENKKNNFLKMNKFQGFTPLMHKLEYELIEKYLSKDDIFLEWGSGNSTIYFSDMVKKVITIEHDRDYWNQTESAIKIYDIKNIDNIFVSGDSTKTKRDEIFWDYINYPMKNKLDFNRILVDGRARKYCAMEVSKYIDDNCLVFIHDFNHNDVEGYPDETYFEDILKYYDIVERVTEGQGIVALKKKNI